MHKIQRDPVCGMSVYTNGHDIFVKYEENKIHFCSELCKELFLRHPSRYTERLIPETKVNTNNNIKVAYFSMEVAINTKIPTYSGGLGVLAGDTLKSFASLNIPAVGVTLLYRKGYFEQKIGSDGYQEEYPVKWKPHDFLKKQAEIVQVEIEGRNVSVAAWIYNVVGSSGYIVPLIFLDTDLEENSSYDRTLTDYLYGGDQKYRLSQEIVLGIGGIRMLKKMGYSNIERFHMNEGHAALLSLELLKEEKNDRDGDPDFQGIKQKCVFTTHTPVAAGHDKFDYALVNKLLDDYLPFDILKMIGGKEELNLTSLGLNMSHYINGVAKKHEEISREMFPGYPIHHITNGVDSWTWTSDSFKDLYSHYITGWNNDPFLMRLAVSIPDEKIWQAHIEVKKNLLNFVKSETGINLSEEVLTIGFARRATLYKRPLLIFSDILKLIDITKKAGPVQFIFSGKAHPKDFEGKELIRQIISLTKEIEEITIVYLENYDKDLAKLMVSGVDLWLNTPLRPLEASGTSGMKAAHNGVPSFSILDGWWLEGHIEGITGWSIGDNSDEINEEDSNSDAEDMYNKLENTILPLFYKEREKWIGVMKYTIALNASFFNAYRMAQQYITNAYFL